MCTPTFGRWASRHQRGRFARTGHASGCRVLPAHRLPDGKRDRIRCERMVVRGAHREGRSAVGAQVGRGTCGITAGDGCKGQKGGDEREADTHGQEPQVGGPQAVARTHITILRQERARRLTKMLLSCRATLYGCCKRNSTAEDGRRQL